MLFMWSATDTLLLISNITNGITMGLQLAQIIVLNVLMNNLSKGAWLLQQARKFCIEFDQILVRFSEQIYGYFIEIVNVTLITPEIIDGLLSKVWIITGLFIFFKLAIVSMRYMVNPESFADDKIGANTLVKRIILGSVIIILTPTIFNFANRFQEAIIQDRVIEKIILPEKAYKELTKTVSPGRDLAMLVFRGFFDWNENIAHSSSKSTWNSFQKVDKYNDIALFDKSLINEEVGEVYAINYIPIISTLAVGYLLFMLIKYTIEVAFREFKLMFLRILFPFVIVEYMLDTTKEEMMKKWLNSTISTYILIFIRVITIWLATLFAYYLRYGVEGESLLNNSDPLLKCLIVLAIFAFLKDLPKLVSEIFGYNLQENETIGGIMNQGVNVIKGFAMSKVARGVTQPARTLGYASMATGAIAGVAGGLAGDKMGFRNASSNLSSMSSMTGSTISSTMGQTILGPVAQTASSSSQGGHAEATESRDKGNKKDNGKKDFNIQNEPKVSLGSVSSNPTLNNNFQNIVNEAQQQAINDVTKNINATTQQMMNANITGPQMSNTSVNYQNITNSTYTDGTPGTIMPNDEYGRFTTYRDRSDETGMQQRVNDIAHVHEPLSGSELAEQVQQSAFSNISDDAFRAYQEKNGIKNDE